MIGRTIAHYEILRVLGEGGMGVVYEARDAHLDRLVALKVLPIASAADPERRLRFVQEAKAASALRHPNIVTIHDIDHRDGFDFIAMEHVAGRTLAEHAFGRCLPWRDAARLAAQVADALAAAHAAGIVHRDLKPSNLMVSEDGTVKVLDFGLAKLVREDEAAESGTTLAAHPRTAEGRIVGTVAYMSPEQAEGRKVDARSDIFSFGAILYEMVAGRRPFAGETTASTVSNILRSDPPPMPDELPHDLKQVIRRCLRKDVAQRFQHMDDVRVALQELLDEPGHVMEAGPPRGGGRSRALGWAALFLLAGVALLAAANWLYRHGRTPVPGALVPLPLTSYAGSEGEPSFSPDGNQVAFVWDGAGQDNADIYVKLIGTEEPLRLTRDPAPDVSPAWSPDGRTVAFVRLAPAAGQKSELLLVPAIGGPERRLGEVAGGSDRARVVYRYWTSEPHPLVAWAPAGQWLVVSDVEGPGKPHALFALSPESGERRRLTWPPGGSSGDSAPAISPDGRTLVFARTTTFGISELQRLRLTADFAPDGDPAPITSSRRWSESPSWLPDGREIVFSSGQWALGAFDLWRVAVSEPGDAVRLPFAGQDASAPTVARQGHRLAFCRQLVRENIFRLALVGARVAGGPAPFIATTRVDHNPQYSPDGRRIAFLSSRSGTLEVWVANADGSGLVQLTSMGAPITGSARWSPDGQYVVFDSNREGNFELYAVAAAGGRPRRLTTHPAVDAIGSFSHDGRWIYFQSTRSTEGSRGGLAGREIWRLAWRPPGEATEPVRLTMGGGTFGFETPDGRFFYYSSGRELLRMPVDGGTPTRIDDAPSFLNMAVTREGVYFITTVDKEGLSKVCFRGHDARSTRPLMTLDGPVGQGLAVSPDGKTLLLTRQEEAGSDLMLVEGFP